MNTQIAVAVIGAVAAVLAAVVTATIPELFKRIKKAKMQLRKANAEFEESKIYTNKRLDLLGEKIDELFLHSMSETEYKNLRRIVNSEFCNFKDMKPGSGLDRELRDLRDRGYIRLTKKVSAIKEIPEHGDNLIEFLTYTDAGKRFVTLRGQIDRSKNKAELNSLPN